MSRSRHTLVVRFAHGSGRVQVCCFCRPRSVADRQGEPLTGWEFLTPDQVVEVYHDHKRNKPRAR